MSKQSGILQEKWKFRCKGLFNKQRNTTNIVLGVKKQNEEIKFRQKKMGEGGGKNNKLNLVYNRDMIIFAKVCFKKKRGLKEFKILSCVVLSNSCAGDGLYKRVKSIYDSGT